MSNQDTSGDEAYAAAMQRAEMGSSEPPVAVVATAKGPAHTGMPTATAYPASSAHNGLTAITVVRAAPQQPGAVMAIPAGGIVSGGEYSLSELELVMFSYRSSVKCFAYIDIFFSLLSLFTSPVVVVFLGLVGPACGYYGATKLMKCPTLVYVIVLFMKTISLLILAFSKSSTFWNVVLALLQIWITKIVFTFYRALNAIPAGRLETLREPHFLDRALNQHAHAVQVRYI